MITIMIGQCADDKRTVSKNIENSVSISATVKSPCSLTNPTFQLKYNAAYLSANYLYCPDFGRYYFIDNIILNTGNAVELQCSVDVLMSFADEIKNLNCTIVRNENNKNPLLIDSKYIMKCTTQVQNYIFPDTIFLNESHHMPYYVLCVAGGTNNAS